MTEIFKVCQLNKDSIEKMLIFFGEHDLNDGKKKIDIEELYKLEPENPVFKKIFTKEENDNIKKENISIEFIEYKIYMDDSIEDIKKKIILAYEKQISFDSIYLFGLQEEKLNLVKVYQNLTQNEKLDLTRERLTQFLLNFDDHINIDVLEKKPIYNFEDLLDLDLNSRHIIKKPIGQQFIANDLKYQYTINPFDVVTYDHFLQEYAENIVSTQNSNLLLDFGTLKYNTIYLALAEDVFKYENESGINLRFPTVTSKVYYPFLFKENITDEAEFIKKKEELLSSNKKFLGSGHIHKMRSIDLFYKLNEKNKMKYISTGITSIEINLHPDVSFIMPLDIVFKLIHAKKNIPFIKYNPGNRKEKIYKLYSDEVSSDGRRIPYLNKATIFNLMKVIGKGKSVTVYLDIENNGKKLPLMCQFDNSGKINIKCSSPDPLTIEDYTKIISENINPIIYDVKKYIEQSGYNINIIESLYHQDIEIVDIKYIMYLPISKNIHLSRFSGCISSVFNVLNSTLKGGVVMRFKRVANFNIMNAKEATIIELINKGLSRTDVINSLIQNFTLTKEEAETLFAKFLSEVQVERGLFENKKLKIKERPGFLTTITLDKFQSNITIAVENINNIYYLDTIPIYINSLISLTEGVYDKTIKSEVNKLCKGKKTKSLEVVKDIVAQVEQSLMEEKKKNIITKAKEIKFDDDDDDDDEDDFMNMLLGDDEDDDEDGEEDDNELAAVGGADSPDSMDSIPSASPSPIQKNQDGEISLEEDITNGSPDSMDSIPSASPSPIQKNQDGEVSIGEDITSDSPDSMDSIPSASPSPIQKNQDGDVSLEDGDVSLEDGDVSLEDGDVSLEDGDVSLEDGPSKLETSSTVIPENKEEVVSNESDFPLEMLQTLIKENTAKDQDDLPIWSPDKSSSDEDSVKKTETPKSDVAEIIELSKISPMKPKENSRSLNNTDEGNSSDDVEESEIDESSASLIESSSQGRELSDIKPASQLDNSPSKKELPPLSQIDSDDDSEDETFVRDITGMQLSNPNYFSNRMNKRDPALFLKNKQGKFMAYSRMCPSNIRRQPVILTKAELDKIDKEHPGSYDEVIKYGSNPKKQYYYICPRYWCLKNNTSLTEEEVNAGACGGRDAIIPFGAKKVPPGKSIFHFYNKKEHKNSDGTYIKHYPGFIPGSKHPDGYCMPCCFKDWNSPQQINRRKECKVLDEKEQADSPDSLVRVASNEAEEYIKGNEKFPLDQNRWGYLPYSIQKFLHTNNKECQISTTNTNIKPFKVCLVRHGVEISRKQSFIACIADIYADDKDEKVWENEHPGTTPTIIEMKNRLKSALNLDLFITLQNGNLISSFYNDDRNVDIDKYEKSNLYHQINTEEEKELEFIEKAINSYENFIDFLDNDEVVIDYMYLWDLICNPNKKLFSKGRNLIILEIKNDDGTENVELICPTNHYVKNYYNARKKTIILIKKDDFYEPICRYFDMQTTIDAQKTFSHNDPHGLLPNLKFMLSEIKNYMNGRCGALPSQPKVYNFKENIPLKELIKQLKFINGKIKYLVLNFNGKVIGVKAELGNMSGFIPCYPSSLQINASSKLDTFKFINDDEIWESYEDTIDFLNSISSKNKKIPCKIKVKIEEDELIIGFLTETNQFIKINDPSLNNHDELPVITNNDYIIADQETLLNKNIDKKRIEYIKKLKLEKNFYNVFRNTMRITLNKFENKKIRNDIKDIINAPYILYYDKLKLVVEKLHALLDGYIDFYDYKISDILKIESVSGCFNSDCENSWCLRSDSGICKIMLPKNNLVTKQSNEKVYFGKMSDELVRYNRIKLFIFDPKTYLSFTEVKYNLEHDEIILLQSLITQDYFENLEPVISNPFVKSLTYDTANPIITQTYSIKAVSKIEKQIEEIDCIKKTGKITGKWQKFLPNKFSEQIYANTALCTFKLVKDIIKSGSGSEISIIKIKEKLLEEYKKYFSKHGEQNIYDILFNQGKIHMIRQVKHNQLSFEDMVMSEGYYATNLDIWLLSLGYKVPVIFISSTKLLENRKNILPTYYNKNSNYVIIKTPGIRPNSIPKYRVIMNHSDSIFINSLTLPKSFQQMISVSKGLTRNGITIDKFITEYKPLRYVKKSLKKLKLKLTDKTGDVIEVERKNKLVVPPVIVVKPKKKKKKLTRKLKLVSNK